jgi:hypothetical protein
MSKGPEANFWNSIRQNLPKKCIATRIENQHGGGVPDVHILIDSMPVWIELKVTNGNAVKLSPHQVAWHTAYWARGGLSFVLVKSLGSRSLFLFRGSEALPLARGGLSEAQGSRFEGIKEMLAALGPLVLEHYTLLLSPAAPLRASLSPAAPLRVFPPLE